MVQLIKVDGHFYLSGKRFLLLPKADGHVQLLHQSLSFTDSIMGFLI